MLEQAATLGEVGAGIQLSPNACRVLGKLGLLNALEPMAVAPQAIALRLGSSGQPIMQIPLAAGSANRWGAPYWHLHRADLLSALATALEARAPDALQLAWTLRDIDQDDDAVTAHATDGRSEQATLLIGADGVRSRTRQLLFGDDAPRFTGNVAWRAVVPVAELANPPAPVACIWTGRGKHAVTYRLRGGTLANFVGVVERDDWTEESWTQTGSREDVLADFGGFHPTVRGIIEAAPVHHRWALFDHPPLPTWHHGRVVLLGDACHSMLPFVAQGAAQAIEDAWVLAHCLSSAGGSTPTISAALDAYTKQRLPRTTRVQAEARANQRRFHQPDFAYWPLKLAASVAPNAFLARNDWLFGFDVTRRV